MARAQPAGFVEVGQAFLCSSAVAVGDAAPCEVVGRKLDPDTVARQDADSVAPHLAGQVSDGVVTIIERDAEHRPPQGFGDLAFELDLLFLGADGASRQTG